MDGLYIGLMSGTSVDAIDTVLVQQGTDKQQLLAGLTIPWPTPIRQNILRLCQPGDNEIDQLGDLDIQIAIQFAEATHLLLAQQGITADQITAIGSHGQTLRHRPDNRHPFSLQIGDPNHLAELTGITVVADFRRRDMAAGGQGAPLAPAYHQYQFSSASDNAVILNLGGIANITRLDKNPEATIGFDTGPASTLMDRWARKHLNTSYDENGDWAAQGKINQTLLDAMMQDPYFSGKPPKSTGPEYFNQAWLDNHLYVSSDTPPADVQATLMALTVQSITHAIEAHAAEADRVTACGGGTHNNYLMKCLESALGGRTLNTTADYNIDPDYVEAAAFAWFAHQTLNRHSANLPSVTGAKHPVILGGIYQA